MSAEEIRAYLREGLGSHGEELYRLFAIGQRIDGKGMTSEDLRPVLEGIEKVIDSLQGLHDLCRERFPDAEADGRTDPSLEALRDLIREAHAVWDGWNMPVR